MCLPLFFDSFLFIIKTIFYDLILILFLPLPLQLLIALLVLFASSFVSQLPFSTCQLLFFLFLFVFVLLFVWFFLWVKNQLETNKDRGGGVSTFSSLFSVFVLPSSNAALLSSSSFFLLVQLVLIPKMKQRDFEDTNLRWFNWTTLWIALFLLSCSFWNFSFSFWIFFCSFSICY